MDIKQLESLFDDLFPITRSISGNGLRESLAVIGKIIPLEITEFTTGTEFFDWTVPDEWNISKAAIRRTNGETVVDMSDCNLHIMGYSIPFKGRVSASELKNHLYYIKSKPDAIPFVTSYYKPRWGFCLSYSQYLDLHDNEYDVEIDSTLLPGSITIGECVIKGKSDKEILLFSHIGHPSMANDQLSGPITLTAVAKWLLDKKNSLKYTYRIVLAPETIGSIAYIHTNKNRLKEKCLGGFTVVCTADGKPFTFRFSRNKESVSDHAMENALAHSGSDYELKDFSPVGCDERHFNSHGIGIPIGSIMRSEPGSYPEYHTSNDNKDFISFDQMRDSIELVKSAVMNIEAEAYSTAVHRDCEPRLDKHGLYPTVSNKNSGSVDSRNLISLWAYSDGSLLSDIASKMCIPVTKLREYAETLQSINIIKLTDI